jgi:hypothetical protein
MVYGALVGFRILIVYAVGVESTTMDYTLNINRALKKKLKATQRNRTLQYKYTGGGIVITADATIYKLSQLFL